MSEWPAARYESFAAVQQLREPELRGLLRSGDPVERTWAAWHLGVRLGAAVAEELEQRIQIEPHPGVRRHLLVMLAGWGRGGALAARLRDDPEGLVRATAARYLAILAAPRDTMLYELLVQRLRHDRSEEVRETIAANLRRDAPEFASVALLGAIGDGSVKVRRASLQSLLARRSAGDPFPAELRERARYETEADLRSRLLGLWLDAEGLESLLRGVAGDHDALVAEALWVAAESGRRPAWSAVEPLAGRTDPRVMMGIGALFEGRLDRIPLEWLVDFVLRTRDSGQPALAPLHSGRPERLWKGVVDGVAGRLVGRTRESLNPREREAAHQLAQIADAWIRAAREGR